MEKRHMDRRLDQMRAEGTRFVTDVTVGGPGEDDVTTEALRAEYDAVVLAIGTPVARDLPLPGRDLDGVHFAMEYLPFGNREALGDRAAHRAARPRAATPHGQPSLPQLHYKPPPPAARPQDNPCPTYEMVLRVS